MRRAFGETMDHCVKIAMFDLERHEPLHQGHPVGIADALYHPYTQPMARCPSNLSIPVDFRQSARAGP